jgi:two-component system cell cycle response regulator
MSAYKPHILVVDDSSLLRRQVLAEFAELGCTTDQAEHGLDAIRKIHQKKPDLITLDIEMPKLDGYGVCRMLSANASTLGIPVIMISTKTDEKERLRALEAGAVEYFVKPFEAGSLKRLAQSLLGRVRANRTKRIFSVSSEPGLRSQLDATLSRNGYVHRPLEDPAEVLQVLSEEPCNLLLLDFGLPDRGAYQVLDAIKRAPHCASTRVIALAAHSARRDLVNAYYAGASDFVRTPFFSEELLARVERQLHVQTEETELRDLATIDALTRVANRGELVRRAAVEVSRSVRDGKPLGVAIIDIDHFKQINDRLGHPFGDTVLRGVAAELQKRIRETDFIGRYGGEEFVALLPGATPESIKVVVERLRSAVEQLRFQAPDEVLSVTISIGCQNWTSESLPPNIEFSNLLDGADRALYRAKQAGRNRWTTAPEARQTSVASG